MAKRETSRVPSTSKISPEDTERRLERSSRVTAENDQDVHDEPVESVIRLPVRDSETVGDEGGSAL